MHDDTAALLNELRHHWGEAYIIVHPGPDRWLAERRDNHGTVRAGTSEELHALIVADYAASHVGRDVPR